MGFIIDFLQRCFKKNKKKKLDRKKDLQKIISSIDLQLNEDKFNKITDSMIIEQLKEKYHETWKEEYENNFEKIEDIKKEMYKKYSIVLKNMHEVILKEIENVDIL